MACQDSSGSVFNISIAPTFFDGHRSFKNLEDLLAANSIGHPSNSAFKVVISPEGISITPENSSAAPNATCTPTTTGNGDGAVKAVNEQLEVPDSEKDESTKAGTVESRSNLPWLAHYHLFEHLLRLIEKIFFAFIHAHPKKMARKSLPGHPTQVEVTNWVNKFNSLEKLFEAGHLKNLDKPLSEILEVVSQVRNVVVFKIGRMKKDRLVSILDDMERLAHLMQADEHMGEIASIKTLVFSAFEGGLGEGKELTERFVAELQLMAISKQD